MIRNLLAVALLALVYALVIGSFHPIDLLVGVLLAVGLRLAFRRRLPGRLEPPPITLRQLLAFWSFVGAVIWEILVGTAQVMRITLHLHPLPRAGILAVPLRDATPIGVAVWSLVTNLSPGTTVLDVDWDRRVMLVHVLDVGDPESFRASAQRLYERYQRAVFP